ncbi:hypothetical protein V1525DRAFT_388118 [Lipomyces kononenkoae]|uniref:Uncharacterized protein n=1 Tax=Lipomyces kononenkoae TaxID=34357 RepID=A0ACC3T1N1_LIPKO
MSVYGEDTDGTRARSPVAAAIAIARARSSLVADEIAQSANEGAQWNKKNTDKCGSSSSAAKIHNEPEKRLDIQLSYQNFIALNEQAHALYGDAKYPRVEYAASDSRVTIHTVPTALHSDSAHNKQHLINYVLPVGDSTKESVNSQGMRSTKTPDAGLRFDNGTCRGLTLIIEAGVSEGYPALKRDIELWLNEFKFGYPRGSVIYSAIDQPLFDSAMQQARNSHPFGPYSYRFHSWFGPVTKAIIEVFKRDASTGNIESKEHKVVENGTMVVGSDYLKLGLTIGDFFLDVPEIESIRGVPIDISTSFVHHFVASAAQETAESRFSCFVYPSKRSLRPRKPRSISRRDVVAGHC